MTIAIPAILVLIIIAMGFAYYMVFINAAEETVAVVERWQERPSSGDRSIALQVQRVMSLRVYDVLGILLLFSVIGLLSGVGLSWALIRPLRVMAAAAERLASGKGRQAIEIRGSPELDQLGKSFNSLLDYVNTMAEERDTYFSGGIETGLLIVDGQGRIDHVNRAGQRILGAGGEELEGRTFEEISKQRPELAPSFVEFCLRRLRAPAAEFQEETTLPVSEPGEKPLSVACSMLRDETNETSATVFHFRDEARVRNLNMLFSRTDQLIALGAFTFGLSHELRNPLGALKGTAQLLKETVGRRDNCVPYLDRIIREVDRLDALVRELYDFSRAPVVQQVACDPNVLVSEALGDAMEGLAPEVRQGKSVEQLYAESLPPVIVQKDRLQRAIANVIINAFDHMPSGGRLLVVTHTARNPRTGPVVIDVTNTGPHIPDDAMPRIFEPFFSTRERGTGLGLSIAQQIVSQNRGSLEAANVPGGVRFRFTLHNISPRLGRPGADPRTTGDDEEHRTDAERAPGQEG